MRNRNALGFFSLLFSLVVASYTFAQNKPADITAEIRHSLNLWNETAKKADLNAFVDLFDSSPNILLVGSDSGEIFKGKEQISQWASSLFEHHRFEWDMQQIEIDNYQGCAWVFMNGSMIVTNDQGKKSKTPYRFTGVMIKRNGQWKWRLFNGSIPKAE